MLTSPIISILISSSPFCSYVLTSSPNNLTPLLSALYICFTSSPPFSSYFLTSFPPISTLLFFPYLSILIFFTNRILSTPRLLIIRLLSSPYFSSPITLHLILSLLSSLASSPFLQVQHLSSPPICMAFLSIHHLGSYVSDHSNGSA